MSGQHRSKPPARTAHKPTPPAEPGPPAGPCQPLIPSEFRDAAAQAQAAEEARRRASRGQAERDLCCEKAVREFGHATDALWVAPPEQARSLLPNVHAALLGACAALEEAGRLEAWEQTDRERAYDAFRVRNNRVMSRPSYDFACHLLGEARAGRLAEALLTEAWENEGLRDAVRWLRIILYGLSGEGAPLPVTQGPPAPPASPADQTAGPATGTAGEPKQGPTNAAAECPTIYWLGDRTYRVGNSKKAVPVGETYDGILQAFLGRPTLDLKALARRTNMKESHIKIALGRLRKKWDGLFEKAIYCPGVRGSGYQATVVDARLDINK